MFDRLLWYLIQLCAVTAAVYIFLHAWQNFTAKPTFTTLQSVKHPIWEVPFPAVSICSVNKISRKAAWEYAEELFVLHLSFLLFFNKYLFMEFKVASHV